MYDYLEGTAMSVTSNNVMTLLITNTGIGVPVRICEKVIKQVLENSKQTVKLRVRSVFNQDKGYSFFGFTDDLSRMAFDLLCSVKGVGGNKAMDILDSMSVQDLATALTNKDEKTLAKAKGIAKRGAVLMIADLYEKAEQLLVSDPVVPAGGYDPEPVILSLVTLGYSKTNATNAVHTVLSHQICDPSELIDGEVLRAAIASMHA